MPGQTLVGDADYGVAPTQGLSDDIIVEVHKKMTGRAIKYTFKSNTIDLYYKFLSLAHTFQTLPNKRLKSTVRTYITS